MDNIFNESLDKQKKFITSSHLSEEINYCIKNIC